MAAWTWVTENWTEVVAVIGAVVIVARLIVKLTPSDSDNKVVEKIVAFLKAVGLHVKD